MSTTGVKDAWFLDDDCLGYSHRDWGGYVYLVGLRHWYLYIVGYFDNDWFFDLNVDLFGFEDRVWPGNLDGNSGNS